MLRWQSYQLDKPQNSLSLFDRFDFPSVIVASDVLSNHFIDCASADPARHP